jgi:CBS domain-containing protein
MPRKTLVSEIMTRDVHTLEVTSKLSVVRHALVANEFHHMPVVDDGRLVGVLSWRDIVRAFRGARGDGEVSTFEIDDLLDQYISIEELMTKELVTVRDDDVLDRAIDKIADGHIHSVLVLDGDERLVGIVTDKNIMEFLMSA